MPPKKQTKIPNLCTQLSTLSIFSFVSGHYPNCDTFLRNKHKNLRKNDIWNDILIDFHIKETVVTPSTFEMEQL